MTTPASHSAPEIPEIETLLKSHNISPGDRFYKLVAKADWMTPAESKVREKPLPRRFRWALVLFGVLLAVGLLWNSPAGRTFAQAVSRFFKISPSENQVLTVETAPDQTPDPGYPYKEYTLAVTDAEALAGFSVKAPTNLGEGWQFHGAKFELEHQQVALLYTFTSPQSVSEDGHPDIYLYIREQASEFENSGWGACPTNALVITQVNGWPAELLDGAVWVTMTRPEPGVQQKWWCEEHEAGRFMTLRWQEEKLRYEISLTQLLSDTPVLYTRERLVEIAESME